jgi:FKBP-type peptidyl-prolyl cis-trans isomerase (trigger factor)
MKPSIAQINEKPGQDAIEQNLLSLARVREIMEEEGIQYTDEELQEVIEFISKWIIISTDHYKRLKERNAKIISLNSSHSHETKSISIHSRKYGRTG